MAALRRTEAGGFSLADAVELSSLEAMSEEERCALVLPVERIFEKYRSVCLSDFFSRLARAGQQIYLKKIGFFAESSELISMYDKNGFFAIGEVREYEDGYAIKPIRQFANSEG